MIFCHIQLTWLSTPKMLLPVRIDIDFKSANFKANLNLLFSVSHATLHLTLVTQLLTARDSACMSDSSFMHGYGEPFPYSPPNSC